jgi:hypothetical protein
MMAMEISSRQLKMRTPEGFDQLFEQAINKGKTQPEVFEQMNAEFKEAFGESRYKNFESYRVTRQKRIKKKLNKS